MIHNITKEQYLLNPCRRSSVAYWKCTEMNAPDNIDIIHEKDFLGDKNCINIKRYFRLCHDLKTVNTVFNSDFIIRTVDYESEKNIVADILGKCYETVYPTSFVDSLTKTRVYDEDLWILAVDSASMQPAALGIADFDADIKEGSLEWIQVLPNNRRLGLGAIIVSELLRRLKEKADFVTVSGQADNSSNPESLYRKCGFSGNDIWYIIEKQ